MFNILAVLSLLMCAAVCVLWVRARTGSDQVTWTYDRWLADGSAASSQAHLSTDRRRVWLRVNWGEVGPPNGQLVWGYYMNADQSGGRPRLRFDRQPYDPWTLWILGNLDRDAGTSGWGPLQWQFASRSRPKDGDDHCVIGVGVAYWMLALLLLVPPGLWVRRFRRQRRAARVGKCPKCGYDLRASPERCPECGQRREEGGQANLVT